MATWKKILTEGNVVPGDLASGADAGEILKVASGGTALEWGSSTGTVTSVTANAGTVSGIGITSTGGSTPEIALTGGVDKATIKTLLSSMDSGDTLQLGDDDADATIVIKGNLTVTGTTTTMNTEEIQLADNDILLNSNLDGSVAPTESAGLGINRGSLDNKFFFWDEDDTIEQWCVGDSLGVPKARVGLFETKSAAPTSGDDFEGLGMLVWDTTGNNLYIRTDD